MIFLKMFIYLSRSEVEHIYIPLMTICVCVCVLPVNILCLHLKNLLFILM